jgi:acyl carrier protein
MTVNIEDIKRVVSLQMGIRDVGDKDHFLEELGAESLDVLNIIAAIEEKYNVAIKDSEIPDLQTPTALYMFVKERSKTGIL